MTLLDMTVKGCSPYAKAVEGSADEESDDEIETAVAVKSEAPKSNDELPGPIFKVLRFIIEAIAAFFRSLRPYLPPELFDPIPPSTVNVALQRAQATIKQLEEISLKCVTAKGQKRDISREVSLIDKSMKRIEEIAAKSKVS